MITFRFPPFQYDLKAKGGTGHTGMEMAGVAWRAWRRRGWGETPSLPVLSGNPQETPTRQWPVGA